MDRDAKVNATQPTFFASPAALRRWLQKHHDKRLELWVGFHKKGSGKPSITWPESVDEALCFGWIDGVRKRIDDTSYVIRFTPRKRGSIWSSVNVKRVAELTGAGRMQPAGLRAFEARKEAKSGIYSYEQKTAARLDDADERRFRANKKAWEFFQAQPPSYKHLMIWRVISAKKAETRLKRLAMLIEYSAQRRRV
jgi:uncharacterized protein YdeI (YjbR/CyaY-like superfamily)